MTVKRVYTDYLRDILDASEKAAQFVSGVEYEAFLQNDEKIFAVIRAVQVIGEAAKNLPVTVQARAPEVDWRGVIGMRDKLSHLYLGADLQLVWDVIQKDLPNIRTAVARLLAELEGT